MWKLSLRNWTLPPDFKNEVCFWGIFFFYFGYPIAAIVKRKQETKKRKQSRALATGWSVPKLQFSEKCTADIPNRKWANVANDQMYAIVIYTGNYWYDRSLKHRQFSRWFLLSLYRCWALSGSLIADPLHEEFLLKVMSLLKVMRLMVQRKLIKESWEISFKDVLIIWFVFQGKKNKHL